MTPDTIKALAERLAARVEHCENLQIEWQTEIGFGGEPLTNEERGVIAIALRRLATQQSEPLDDKLVYIKPLRTLVRIQTGYADQIRDLCNATQQSGDGVQSAYGEFTPITVKASSSGLASDRVEAVQQEAELFVVRKRGYFYRPNAAGYTSNIDEAGKWTKAEADLYAENCEGVVVRPVSDFPKPLYAAPVHPRIDDGGGKAR